MPAIVITDGLGKRTRMELESGQRYSLGQSDDNDIPLSDHLLSRRHAEIYPEDNDWLLADCGSALGTFLGGDRLTTPVRLGPDSVIVLGRCELRFEPDRGPRVVLRPSALEPAGLLKTPVTELMRESWEGRSTPRGELESARRRLAIVERAGSDLLAHDPPDVLLQRLLDLLVESIRPGRIALVYRGEDGELECRACRGQDDPEISIGRGLAAAALDERSSVLTSEIRGELQAVMAAPLWNDEGVAGMIYVDSPMRVRRFTYADLKLLTMMGKIAAIQIRNSTLFEARIERRLAEAQHRAAAEIQRQLLPPRAPAIPGYAFAGHSIPCHEVGGDYFDCVPLDENRHGIILGDVAGRGMGAALLMAVLQATFRARAETAPPIQDLVRQLNELRRSRISSGS